MPKSLNAPSRLTRAIRTALAISPLVFLPHVTAAQNVDLGNLGTGGFRIDGIDAFDDSGYSVSGAGDVNGDGLADLIVGASLADPGGDTNAGESYIVFGKADSAPVNLANLGAGGFRIDGIDAFDRSGRSVSGAGDVNGDGLADLIVGASLADPGGDSEAGESYVVFGKTDTAPVNLADLGAGGFRIDGIDVNDYSGVSVSGAGDVNGDGLADLIVGARGADPGGDSNAGESYVVFGKADSAPVNLADLGAGGFRIDGIDTGDNSGRSVSGAGDVNGDGLADLIVGARNADPGGDSNAGESYVVFGKADSATVDLADLGVGGFRIDGIDVDDYSGVSASGAGDVNGDGLADLIVGAYGADPGGDSNAGESYVVFGKADSAPVNLADLGAGGFRIDGIDVDDRSGVSVSGAGDVNGDGLADLIVGALGADPGDDSGAGESYVVFGKASVTTVDLANLGAGGFRIDGIDSYDFSGRSVSGAGDVNGDGLADLIIGASSADTGGDTGAGESYVVFSASVPLPSATYRVRSRNGNPPRTAVGISGDGSNDSTPDARFWIDFADGNDLIRDASIELVTLTRSPGALPMPGALVSWCLQSSRQNWTAAEVTVRYLDSELLATENALELVFSPNGSAPFTPLTTFVDPQNNTLRASISEPGFFYVGQLLEEEPVDLGNLADRGFRIDGIDTFDESGLSVSGAGDVNGDGLADLIIGAHRADPNGNGAAGESYVVFGKANDAPVDLADLGTGGFRMDGISANDRSGFSVSGAGDVNGDGLADLIVGARNADPGGDSNAGESYVVFGKTDTALVNLANLGAGGFRIDGIDASDNSGRSVAGAGDVNGDGLGDLIIGADGGDNAAGESYVVFGKASSSPVDLANLGAGGFRIDGIDTGDNSGRSVSGAGDVNGDGLADLIVGAQGGDPDGDNGAGESYVVFGKARATAVDLANLGAGGFRIDGIDSADFSGFSVAGAGDVNGDGLADLIIGAYGADPGGDSGAGESYVVFGKADTVPVNLADLGAGGFRIDGIDAYDLSGFSVSGAGDVNGDGLADLIVGALGADPGGDSGAGESYVVFGKTSTTRVDLANLGVGGFRIDGIDVDDYSGASVSGAGDVNGDGLADLIVGAFSADPGGDNEAGESYVVFSASVPLPSATYRVRSRNGNPPRTAVGISGDGSNDGTPDARFWIDFADGNDLIDEASLEVITLTRSPGALPSAGAPLSWRLQSSRQNWTAAEVTVRYLDSELLAAENALELVFSPNGSAPFTPLVSQVNPQNNTISANITQPGFLYIGQRELPDPIFTDRFESSPP